MCDSVREEKLLYTFRISEEDTQVKLMKDKFTGEKVYLLA